MYGFLLERIILISNGSLCNPRPRSERIHNVCIGTFIKGFTSFNQDVTESPDFTMPLHNLYRNTATDYPSEVI